MRVRSAALVLLVALGACGTSAASDGSSTATSTGSTGATACGPRAGRTLAAGPRARVYSLDGAIYGCAARSGRRYRLGAGISAIRQGRVGPVALAGEVAAYGLTNVGVDTGSAQVIVRNLADGRQLSAAPASSLVLVESFQSLGSIVVRADGDAAWISQTSSVIGHGSELLQVWREYARGRSLLDSGRSIAAGSLRLVGSRLTWRDAGNTHSVTLR